MNSNPFEAIPEDYRKLCDLIGGFRLPKEKDINELVNLIESSDRIICVGVGRSGDNADTLARFLRNLGFEKMYGPEEIPYVFKSSDFVLAFSGSGTTTYTLQTAKTAKEAGARVLSLTSNVNSPLTEISDHVLYMPGKTKVGHEEDYFGRQIIGVVHAPLTPLGTLYELRTLFFELSLVTTLAEKKDIQKCFEELLSLCKDFTPSSTEFQQLYDLLPKPRSLRNPLTGKNVVIGEGLSGMVGRFFVTRLRHCAKEDEERECYFWKDRGSISIKDGDLTLVISGSGENIPAQLAEKAKGKGAKVTAITSYPSSTLASIADARLIIPGRTIQKMRGLRSSYLPTNPKESIFELRTLLSLECFIYALAQREGVTEREMWEKHSDFI